MGTDATLIIVVSVALLCVIILYFILTVRFLVKKSREKNQDEGPVNSFLNSLQLGAWNPFKAADTKCIPIQPRTYDELRRSEERLVDSGPTNLPPEKSAGKMKFSLRYDSLRSTLMVSVHKIQQVLGIEAGDVTYYVTLKILPQNHRSFQTKAVKKCKNPEFNETFEFRVVYEKLQTQSVKMTLCCFDRFSHHDTLGELLVHLADLEARGLSLSREILLFRDIHVVQKTSGTLGELMVSLGYLRLTERLTIVIIRARDLPQVDDDEPPAPYVDVSLVHDEIKLKQKKTLVKEPQQNPVFNETLTFHIPIGILHQTSLLLSMMHRSQKRTGDELLGQVILGPQSTGSQFEHWNDMRVNNKPIARWHKLFE